MSLHSLNSFQVIWQKSDSGLASPRTILNNLSMNNSVGASFNLVGSKELETNQLVNGFFCPVNKVTQYLKSNTDLGSVSQFVAGVCIPVEWARDWLCCVNWDWVTGKGEWEGRSSLPVGLPGKESEERAHKKWGTIHGLGSLHGSQGAGIPVYRSLS